MHAYFAITYGNTFAVGNIEVNQMAEERENDDGGGEAHEVSNSSQRNLLISHDIFCIIYRHTVHMYTGNFTLYQLVIITVSLLLTYILRNCTLYALC